MEKKETFVHDLSSILLKHGIFSEREIRSLQKSFKEASQETFDEFLLDEGLIEKEDLLKALSEYYKTPAIDLAGYFFQTFLLRKFPKEVMLRNTFIPLEVDQNFMIVVAGEPDNPELLSVIGKYVSYDIQFRVSIQQDIIDAIREYYDKSDTEVTEDLAIYDEYIDEDNIYRIATREEEGPPEGVGEPDEEE
jgi:type IV pilus assembly protein PilB